MSDVTNISDAVEGEVILLRSDRVNRLKFASVMVLLGTMVAILFYVVEVLSRVAS